MSGSRDTFGRFREGVAQIAYGNPIYQFTLGGSGAEDASLGTILGPALPYDRVADAVDTLVDVYLRERTDGERFLDTFRRTGVAPFKEAVYADAH